MEEENTPLVRSVGVIDENLNFVPYGSTAIEDGVPVFVFDTKEEYDQHAPTLPEPCVVITLDDIDTGGFEFDSAIDPESENAVQNKVIAAALEALRDKATFDRPGMVRFTDATTVTDRNSGYALSAIEKNATVPGSLMNEIKKVESKEIWHVVDIDLVPSETIWAWNSVEIPEAVGAIRVKAYDNIAHVWSQTIENFEGINRVNYTNGILDDYNVSLQLEFSFSSGSLLLISQRVPQRQEVRFTKFAYQK